MTETPTPRRPRFSLRTLLTLTAWLAMGITIYFQWRELAPLQTEVKKLRDETGKLWIEDEKKIHAIQVVTDNSQFRTWRIWFPPGQSYYFAIQVDDIPEMGERPGHASYQLFKSNGEVVVRHLISRDYKSGYETNVSLEGDNVKLSFGPMECSGFIPVGVGVTQGVGRSLELFDSDQPCVLLRYRGKSGKTDSPSKPTPGFLIWIEPAK